MPEQEPKILPTGGQSLSVRWTDEPETVAECDDCLELVAEDLADDNEHRGQCLDCRQVISAKDEAIRRPWPTAESTDDNGSPVLQHPGDIPLGLDSCVDCGTSWAAVLTLGAG